MINPLHYPLLLIYLFKCCDNVICNRMNHCYVNNFSNSTVSTRLRVSCLAKAVNAVCWDEQGRL